LSALIAICATSNPRTESKAEKLAAILNSAPAAARAGALFKIAASFSAFDSVRGFEVAQMAIKAANELLATAESRAEQSPASAKGPAPQPVADPFEADSERTLTQLARIDFIRALGLAQQFSRKEAAVVAQLAVCRGGLESEAGKEQAQAVTETESGANQ